jgi:hypothetical protein
MLKEQKRWRTAIIGRTYKAVSKTKGGIMQLPVAARKALQEQVANHPKLVALKNARPPEQMSKRELIEAAQALQIDIKALKKHVREQSGGMESIMEEKPLARLRHSEQFPAFNGIIEFDLTIGPMNFEVKRRARLVWESTPEWQYFDLHKMSVTKGWPGQGYHMEILALPDGSGWEPDADGKYIRVDQPYWTRVNLFDDGILPQEFYDAISDQIDEDCRRQDGERRRAHLRDKAVMQ